MSAYIGAAMIANMHEGEAGAAPRPVMRVCGRDQRHRERDHGEGEEPAR